MSIQNCHNSSPNLQTVLGMRQEHLGAPCCTHNLSYTQPSLLIACSEAPCLLLLLLLLLLLFCIVYNSVNTQLFSAPLVYKIVSCPPGYNNHTHKHSTQRHQWTWARPGPSSPPVHGVCQACIWGVHSSSESILFLPHTSLKFTWLLSLTFPQTKKYADIIIPRGAENNGKIALLYCRGGEYVY